MLARVHQHQMLSWLSYLPSPMLPSAISIQGYSQGHGCTPPVSTPETGNRLKNGFKE